MENGTAMVVMMVHRHIEIGQMVNDNDTKFQCTSEVKRNECENSNKSC